MAKPSRKKRKEAKRIAAESKSASPEHVLPASAEPDSEPTSHDPKAALAAEESVLPSDNAQSPPRLSLGRGNWLVLIIGTALALGSFNPQDPWVFGPMLVISWGSFIWLLASHTGRRLFRIAGAIIVTLALSGIAYKNSNQLYSAVHPFKIGVRTAVIVDIGPTNVSRIMATYHSVYGHTSSPVSTMVYLTITNLQSVASNISDYSIYTSNFNNPRQWSRFIPIDTDGTTFYFAGGPPQIRPGMDDSLRFKLGTGACLFSSPKAPALKDAMYFFSKQWLGEQFKRALFPRQTISGWVPIAFDEAVPVLGKFLKIALRDASGVSYSEILSTPQKSNDDPNSVDSPELILTDTKVDISSYYQRLYGDPYPAGEQMRTTRRLTQ